MREARNARQRLAFILIVYGSNGCECKKEVVFYLHMISIQAVDYPLHESSKISRKRKLSRLLAAYWPAVALVIGGIVTLAWAAVLVWVILRLLRLV